jgi:hypothetical protein
MQRLQDAAQSKPGRKRGPMGRGGVDGTCMGRRYRDVGSTIQHVTYSHVQPLDSVVRGNRCEIPSRPRSSCATHSPPVSYPSMHMPLRASVLTLVAVLLGCGGSQAEVRPQPTVHPVENSCVPLGEGAGGQVPTRGAVAQNLSLIADDVRRCSPFAGTAFLRFAFRSDGTLERVDPHLPDHSPHAVADEAVLQCILEHAREICLPPFQQKEFRVSFPYRVGPAPHGGQ